MIDKVLIAEDQESANLSLQKTVAEMQISHIDHAFYCDEAINKIRVEKQKNQSYDLLITDLYFESDGTIQTINSGFELIAEVHNNYPEVMILVFSAEQRAAILEKLYNAYHIDAYVRKARHDAKELKVALEVLARGQRYYPRTMAQFFKKNNAFEFTEFDIKIISLLAQGYQQNQIPDYLKQNNIKPSSLSSIEKRLNQIREEHGFTKNEQLVLFCKDAGIL